MANCVEKALAAVRTPLSKALTLCDVTARGQKQKAGK